MGGCFALDARKNIDKTNGFKYFQKLKVVKKG